MKKAAMGETGKDKTQRESKLESGADSDGSNTASSACKA